MGGAAGRAAAASNSPAASLSDRSDKVLPRHAHRGYTEYKQEMQSLGKILVIVIDR